MEKGDASAAEEMSDLLARNPGYGGAIAKMMANRPEATNIHYAFVLRNLKEGWTLDQRKAYFRWLDKARRLVRRGELPGVHQQHRQGRLRERLRGRAPGRRGRRGPQAATRSRNCPSPRAPATTGPWPS